MGAEQYKIYFQPLETATSYSTNIDVSDYVVSENFTTLSTVLDRYDFNIGTYRFTDVNVTLDNAEGKFNATGTNSIFTYSRDKTKVKIYFVDKDGVENIVFNGLTSEVNTKGVDNNDFVSFVILSNDSILDRVQVESGDISNGDTFKEALEAILNKTEITRVLTFSASNISPNLNYTIDDASVFTKLLVKDVLNSLLFASNSIFYTNNNVMYVSDRSVGVNDTITFYGFGDTFGRENILTLTDYVSGYNSIYNSVSVNGTNYQDATSISTYGVRRKSFDLDFITNSTTELNISTDYVNEFKDPKRELSISFENKENLTMSLLDSVAINLVDTNYNNIDILETDRFKILGITENPQDFIRQSN